MFYDEEVIEQRRRQREIEQDNSGTGASIGGTFFQFERELLFQDAMAISLPVYLCDMESEQIRRKYPSENRPAIIKSNPDGTLCFTLDLQKLPAATRSSADIRSEYKLAVQKLHPNFNFLYQEDLVTVNTQASWMDFKGMALDGSFYYFVGITFVEGRILTCTATGPFGARSNIRELAVKIMESIEDLTLEGTQDDNT